MLVSSAIHAEKERNKGNGKQYHSESILAGKDFRCYLLRWLHGLYSCTLKERCYVLL